ncbi:MAG: hypothetical protein RL031_730 [Actinomycetota bacterium]|jgi:hypothetical protein
MTPPKKPDWIELADSDGGSNNLAPVAKKSRPLVVAMAALTLTFGGAVIAQTYQGGSGDSAQPSLVQASQSAAIATSVNQVKSVQSTSIKAPSIGKSAVPAIAIPPSMNGGDDDYDEDDDEDDYEEDDHDDEDRDDH